jgi:NADP-dependent 3-hydroxy acid dehydrogenase YdfG
MIHQVAILTCEGSGIGLAITIVFTSKGKYTIIIGRTRSKLNKVCKFSLDNSSYEIFDLSGPNAISELIENIREQNQHIDMLDNNAGMHRQKNICRSFRQRISPNSAHQ